MQRSIAHVLLGVTVAVWLAVTTVAAADPNHAAAPRVRAFDAEVRQLVDEGIERSITFRRLVDRIDRTDGIVYVQPGPCSIGSAMSCLLLAVHEAGNTRYLRINLPPWRHAHDERIMLIGHELQHANEVLSTRWVRTDADAHALFMRIGRPTSIRSFETTDAERAGAAIARELAADRAARR